MSEPWWRDEAPSRPIKVTGGIQINSTRGATVARTWWSKRFLAVLEQIGVGGRMARGRAYARQGQIVSLDVDAGGAAATVQGTRPRPYAVRVGVPAFGKDEWGRIADALVGDASYTAALLAGEMPHGIEDVFAQVGLSLFPAGPRDLALDCTCPDREVPCKHLAAVCYVLAERFDADPFAMLALRGRDRETLLADLRDRRSVATAAPSHAPPLEQALAAFYVGGAVPVPAAGPDTPSDAVLDQLPPFPVALRGISVTELLRPAYRALGGAG